MVGFQRKSDSVWSLCHFWWVSCFQLRHGSRSEAHFMATDSDFGDALKQQFEHFFMQFIPLGIHIFHFPCKIRLQEKFQKFSYTQHPTRVSILLQESGKNSCQKKKSLEIGLIYAKKRYIGAQISSRGSFLCDDFFHLGPRL